MYQSSKTRREILKDLNAVIETYQQGACYDTTKAYNKYKINQVIMHWGILVVLYLLHSITHTKTHNKNL